MTTEIKITGIKAEDLLAKKGLDIHTFSKNGTTEGIYTIAKLPDVAGKHETGNGFINLAFAPANSDGTGQEVRIDFGQNTILQRVLGGRQHRNNRRIPVTAFVTEEGQERKMGKQQIRDGVEIVIFTDAVIHQFQRREEPIVIAEEPCYT